MTTEEIFLSTPIAQCWGVKPPPRTIVKPVLQPDQVITVCERHTGIKYAEMKRKTRKREVSQARQITMRFLKNYTVLSLKSIGEKFDGDKKGTTKHYRTIIHATQTVTSLMEVDNLVLSIVTSIQAELDSVAGIEVVVPVKKVIKRIATDWIIKPTPPRLKGNYSNKQVV